MDFLIDGQISSDHTEAMLLTLNTAQTHSIFVNLEENTFLGMPKVRSWSIFTLSMP